MKVVDCELEPDANVIEQAETLLEMAKSGDMQGVIIIGTNRRREVTTAYSGLIEPFTMAGALESVKLRVLNDQCESVRLSIQEAVT